MRRDECDCTANSPASCCLLASKLVAAYAAFALFGFLFGFHWLVVAACCWRRRRDWLTALLHFALYIFMVASVGVGGGWCRSPGNYVNCTGGEDMSSSCLWEEQRQDYQVIYVLHYIALGWLGASWVLDLIQLPSWILQGHANVALTLLFSSRPLAPWYSTVLAGIVVVITPLWSGILPWTTAADPGGALSLNSLALILLGVILGLAAVAALLLRSSRCRPKDKEALAVSDD